MTALIDTIRRAFIEGRNQWDIYPWEWVDPQPLIDALEVHAGVSEDDAEAAVTEAYRRMIAKWGQNDWAWQAGEVAEAICAEVSARGLVPVPG